MLRNLLSIIRSDGTLRRNIFNVSRLAALALLITGIGFISASIDPLYVIIGLITSLVALLLFSIPELALAIYFSGSNIYFYILFKFDIMPNTITTGLYWSLLIIVAALGLLIVRHCKINILPIDIGVVVLFAWIGVSYWLFSYGTEWALNRLKFAPTLAIAPFFVARLVNRRIMFEKFADFVLLLGKITAPIFAFELFTTFRTAIRFAPFYFGTDPNVNNPIVIGTTFSIVFIVLYWKIISGKEKFTLQNTGWFALFILIIVRAASRGPEISLIIAIVAMHLMRPVRLRQIIILILVGIICAFVVIRTPDYVIGFYERTLVYTEKNSAVLRLVKWDRALNLFFDNPVFGVGFGQFSNSNAFAHNIMLEVAAELGLVGLLTLTYILVLTFITAYRSLKSTSLNSSDYELVKLFLTLLIFSFAEAQFSGFLTRQTYFFMSLGLMWGLLNIKRQDVHLKIPYKGLERG